MKDIAVIGLAALLVFCVYRLTVVENQRYALLLGMCKNKYELLLPDTECLRKVETRTSWAWHLYYAMFD